MSDQNSPSGSAKKLGTLGLAAIVVSSMIGGGIFSLPQNMAASAGLAAVLIAWVITGVGVFFIANSFKTLSFVRPDLTAGIYMYGKEGFGKYAGFTVAWGYWLCQIFGNVGYAIITMDALNYFFPGKFAGGNNALSIIIGSLLIWVFNFAVLKGTKQASAINIIGTIGKLVPIFVFIIAMVFVFNFDKFSFDVFGNLTTNGEHNLGTLPAQIKSTMLVTLWAFIGIEGAVVMSGRAKSQKDVGYATILGFSGGLIVFVLLSVLPYGFMSQAELADIANPSTAGILEKAVGTWGAYLMNIGLIVAVLASWLAWTMITAEVPFAAANDSTFPKFFAAQNAKGAPSASLWTTSLTMQAAILFAAFSSNAWNTMLSITSVMVLFPYLTSMLFLCKCAFSESICRGTNARFCKKAALLSGVVGAIYTLWLIYAAGIDYVLLSVIFLTLGIPVYIWAQRERKLPAFNRSERLAAIVLVVVSIAAVVLMLDHKLPAFENTAQQTTQQTTKPEQKHSKLIKRHGHSLPIKQNQ